MTDLCAHDAVTLAGMLRRREVSAREVAAAHIARIEAADGAVNAVVTRTQQPRPLSPASQFSGPPAVAADDIPSIPAIPCPGMW